MKRIAILLMFGAGAVLSTGAFAAERPATKAEIEKVAVGRTVSGAMKYFPNGRYTYKGHSPGRYKISDGKICVQFDNGNSRCDRIVVDGKKFTLINRNGERFPFR